MKKYKSKGLWMMLLSLFILSTSYGQTTLKAYSLKAGNISTNGSTKLWSSIGGFSTGTATTSSTTLKPGVLAEGLAVETVLGVLDDLEERVFLYQNFNTNEVIIRNSTSHFIESARVINMEGKTLNLDFAKSRNGNSNLSFKTSNLKAGVYLIQLTIDELPVTKKFLVK